MSRSKRPSPRREDPITSLQETLDTQEARRKSMARRIAVATAALLVIGAVAAVVASGNSAPDGRDVAVTTPQTTAVPAVITGSSAPSATTPAEEPPEDASAAPTEPADPGPATPEPPKPAAKKAKPKPNAPTAQNVRIGFGDAGYSPSTVTASAASPLKLSVDQGEGCAAGFLIPALNISADNSAGPITIDLGKVPAGSYQFSCGMEMVTGTLIVK